jgi:hypothetical protein
MKIQPDHHDAELVLKLYDLRREPVMRASRESMRTKFWPRTWEEFSEFLKPENPQNTAYRQTLTYWEMAFGMARHGIVNADYLAENTGEGLLLFARIHPFLDRLRKEVSPLACLNAEWIVTHSTAGRRIFDLMQARVKKMMSEMKR